MAALPLSLAEYRSSQRDPSAVARDAINAAFRSLLPRDRGSGFTPGYVPYAHQRRFHNSQARFLLLGGAAGPGKSLAIIQEIYEECMANPGISAWVFRRTCTDLDDTLVQVFLDWVPDSEYRYNAGKHIVRFHNGSTVRFRYCNKPADVYRYKSTQMDILAVDELTEMPFKWWQYLASRLRPGRVAGYRPRFIAGTNPGGPSHAQVKALWVDRDQSFANDRDVNLDLSEFEFIPALVTDNLWIMRQDPDYVRRLESLPEDERRALRHGDWDCFQGQFFKEYRRAIHVRAPHEVDIPKEWPRFRAMDYGGTAPFVCLWFAVDTSCSPWRIYVYREYYRAGATLKENVQAVVAMSGRERYRRTVADPSMFARTQEQDEQRVSLADQAKRHGLTLEKAFNPRPDGWAVFRECLAVRDDGLPGLIILETCPNLIRTLPQLIYDPRDSEDTYQAPDVDDHAPDAGRYGLCAIVGKGSQAKAKPTTGARRDASLSRSAYGRL